MRLKKRESIISRTRYTAAITRETILLVVSYIQDRLKFIFRYESGLIGCRVSEDQPDTTLNIKSAREYHRLKTRVYGSAFFLNPSPTIHYVPHVRRECTFPSPNTARRSPLRRCRYTRRWGPALTPAFRFRFCRRGIRGVPKPQPSGGSERKRAAKEEERGQLMGVAEEFLSFVTRDLVLARRLRAYARIIFAP